jgi:hypothetical protein
VGATIVGGILDPRSSQISGDIGELTASRALFERVTIGIFLAWMVVVSIYGLSHPL